MAYYNMPIAEYVYPNHFKEMDVAQDVYLEFIKKKNTTDQFLYVYDLLLQHDWLPKKIDHFIKLSQAHRRWRKHLKKKLQKLGVFLNMNCSLSKKNNDISDLHRLRGNDEFKIKNYEESLKCYTRGMMLAEINSSSFALCVANISAALYYLEEYDHCLKCIDRVLTSKNYPLSHKIFILLERKGNCYRLMNCQTLALKMFSNCLLNLNSNSLMPLAEKEKIKFRISNYMKICQEMEVNTSQNETKMISFSGHINENNPVQTKFVEIKYSEGMGKGLFALKNIKPGEILIVEKPIAGVFKNDAWAFNCNYCFKRCLSGIPCSTCAQVLYCDETCLQRSIKSYHGIECSLVWPLKGDPTVEPTCDLALRSFIQLTNSMGIDHFCSMVREYNESKVIIAESNAFFMDEFYSVYALDGNETKRTVSNLFFMNCTASMMVSLLMLNEYDIPHDLIGNVGESLVHLLCITNLNSYASVELPKYIGEYSNNAEFDESGTFNTVALILCSAYSFINHSCDPNVIVQTYKGVEVTRALQPISKGSQLFTDYGVNFMSHNKIERNKHLLDQYKFTCQCLACMDDWPIYSSLEQDDLCLNNLTHHDADKQLSIPNTTLTKFNEIVHLLLTKQKINVYYLDFLFSFLHLLDSNLKKPCFIYYKCIQVIQRCLYYTSDQLHCSI